MIEFVFKNLVKKKNLSDKFLIKSSGTSAHNTGSNPDSRTISKLKENDVEIGKKTAIKLKKEDYQNYDYIIAMDDENLRNITKIVGDDVDEKIYKLMYFDKSNKDIADPWYSKNFEICYNDINKGANAFFEFLSENHKL